MELSPQQIMSTDPTPRILWEAAVKKCLNSSSNRRGTSKYVLLRSGQLVGTALSIYVKEDVLGDIKNVEGSVKKASSIHDLVRGLANQWKRQAYLGWQVTRVDVLSASNIRIRDFVS